jgi:hypothetical protein
MYDAQSSLQSDTDSDQGPYNPMDAEQSPTQHNNNDSSPTTGF